MTNNVFLKAYFAIVIEAPGLQTEVRVFLKDTTESYTETLEEIHADYRAQTTGEDIRGLACASMTTLTLLRRALADDPKTKREPDVEKAWIYIPFPDSVDHLFLTEYYYQVKIWSGVLSKPSSSYTTSDKPYITNFKLDCK